MASGHSGPSWADYSDDDPIPDDALQIEEEPYHLYWALEQKQGHGGKHLLAVADKLAKKGKLPPDPSLGGAGTLFDAYPSPMDFLASKSPLESAASRSVVE